MTLEELLELQRGWCLTNVHIADVGERDFRLAHTDIERAAGSNGRPCPIHEWLANRHGPPAPVGLYIITDEPGGYEMHRLQDITDAHGTS